MLRALLVDIDGTLVATNGLHAAAWSDACRAFDYDLPPQFFLPMIGMGSDRIVPAIAPELDARAGVGKAIADARERTFLDLYAAQAVPTPGARQLLEAMRRAGITVVVASSAAPQERDVLLARAGVADLVEIADGKAPQSKPDPGPLQAALDHAGASRYQACMLGDTPYDIRAASALEMASVAVRCGGWEDSALSGAGAIFDDPADALEKPLEWPIRLP